MHWFAFSLFSILALAAAELFQQRLLNGKECLSERTSSVITPFLQSLFALVVVLVTPLRSQLSYLVEPSLFPRFLLVSLVGAIGSIFYLRSFKVKSISLSTIFVSGSVIVSTFLGIIFFHEELTFLKIAGIAFVLGAIVYTNSKNAALERNHFFGLAAALCFGITFTLDKSFVSATLHPLIYIVPAFALTGCWNFLISAKEVAHSVQEHNVRVFLPVVYSAAGYFIYNLCTFFAYSYGGEVGKVDAINNSQIFLIILFEFFILKQKNSIFRKLFATAIALIGVFILGLTKG